MSTDKKKEQLAIGYLGEQLVAQWLKQNGWQIVAQGWHCRWGELDIVACQADGPGEDCLAFVEVKTRSRGNWDADGLLAVTSAKQEKLWKTAQLFLTKYPHLAEYPCRFDVALVQCLRSQVPKPILRRQIDRKPSTQSGLREIARTQPSAITWPVNITLGQTITVAGYALTLTTYLEAAFSG